MSGDQKFEVQTQDGTLFGPYPLRAIQAFVIAGKFTRKDLLLREEGACTLWEAEELLPFWQERYPEAFSDSGARDKVRLASAMQSRGQVIFHRGKVLPPGPNPTLAGDLSKVSILKLLFRLWVGKETGRMHCRFGRELVDIFLEEGIPTHAVSAGRETRLGEILVSLNLLSRDRLREALQLSSERDTPLGQVLVGGNLVSNAQLRYAFQRQLYERVFAVFRWKGGVYRFYRDQITGSQFPAECEPLSLLREGALNHMNDALITTALMDLYNRRMARLLNPVLSVGDFRLTPEQMLFYRSITNRDPLNDLLALSVEKGWMSHEETLRLVFLLREVSLIKMGEEMIGERTKKRLEKLKALCEELRGQTRLERLRLKGQPKPAKIRDAYLKLAKKYHPDQLPPGTHPDVIKQASEAFALIAEAYRFLSL